MADDTIAVEVWFAPAPHEAHCRALTMPAGSTLADAVKASGLLQGLAVAEQDALVTAIWGKPREPGTRLRAHDRVELLRPLKVDPKEARRQRYRRDGLQRAPRGAKAPGGG